MKKQIDTQLIAIFSGGLLFNFLFWNEGLALNLLLYSIFIMIVLFLKKENQNKNTILIATSHLVATLLTIYNHSVLNIITYYISLVIFIGFTHAPLIRSVFTALLSGFFHLIASPISLIKKLITVKVCNYSLKPILKPIKYSIIPIFVIILFSFIYSAANPVFENYFDKLISTISNLIISAFTFLLGDLSFARFMHIILGILFTAGILLAFKTNSLEKIEANAAEILLRKRKSKLNPSFVYQLKSFFIGAAISKKMALKTENIIGMISFVSLNLLLLFLNAIDLYTLWLGKMNFIVQNNYSAQVHEGTNSLILSIFMAMAVILYFFNGNLNFFSKNKTIKILAYLWIVQNAFLVCSVLLRDYNYIVFHGLTYKRIGVIIFLMLCAIGLITVYIKVAKKKTVFYLFKVNGLIWYGILIVFGLVNWDVLIINYNIDHREQISLDLDHLIEMSDKTLPLLDKNRAMLKLYAPLSSIYIDRINDTAITEVEDSLNINSTLIDSAQFAKDYKQEAINLFEIDLNKRIAKFKKDQKDKTWLSWNYRDWQTSAYFNYKSHL